MNSFDSASRHAFITKVSVLFGILIFLQQMWGGASLDHVLLTTATSGLVAYLTLAVGLAAAQRIIAHEPPPEDADDAPNTSPEQTADVDPDDATNAPEPQTA